MLPVFNKVLREANHQVHPLILMY